MSQRDSVFSDIRRGNWIDRYLPRYLRPYALLARLDRPSPIWLLLLPAWWAIALAASPGGWPNFWLLFLFGIGSIVMRGAGCTFNDLVDRDYDRRVERTAGRPIASGEISVFGAIVFLAIQLLIGLFILLLLRPLAAGLGVASLLLVATYPFMKRITYWPQAFLGLTFNWGALMGYAAATGRIDPAPVVLYGAGVAWTMVYDTIYAHQDKEDDALIGVKSTALKFGGRTKLWLALFGLVMLALLALTILLGGLGRIAWLWVAAVALHLAWQIIFVNIDDPADCLKKFRANRWLGWAVLIAILLGQFFRLIEPDTTAFVRRETVIASPPLVPEIRLHLASEAIPLWQATEADLERQGLPPPYWAFAWPGGQALARYLLDHVQEVRGLRVLDFAAGSGLAAIAAAKAGAASTDAAEIDRFAIAAIALNAGLNGVAIETTDHDIVDHDGPWDVILAGDVCYERPMAERVGHWFARMAASGKRVLMGDPGRNYLPQSGLAEIARYTVPTSLDLEDRTTRETIVWRW